MSALVCANNLFDVFRVNVFAANIGFVGVAFVLSKLECGDVDWKGGVEEFEFAGGVADAGDGAADNELVAVAEAAGAGEVGKKFAVAWSDETAVAAPEIVNERWGGAVVGMAGDYVIEIGEKWRDFWPKEVKWGMHERDFGFVGGQGVKFFAGNLAKVVLENAWIFGVVPLAL